MRSKLNTIRRQLDKLDPCDVGCANCPPITVERFADDPEDRTEPRPCLLADPSRCTRRVGVVVIEHVGVNRDGSAGVCPFWQGRAEATRRAE